MAVLALRADAGRRIAVTLGCLLAWRVLAQILPFDTNPLLLPQQGDVLSSDSGLLRLLAGSPIPSTYSIVGMGIDPYVYALVIASLVLLASKTVRDMAASPDRSLELRRWIKALAVVLAFFSAYGYLRLGQSDGLLPSSLDWFTSLAIVLELTGGTAVLIMLSDVIEWYGIGFGPFVIFAVDRINLDLQRVAYTVGGNPSADALHLPIALWVASSLVVIVATAALALAVSTIRGPQLENEEPVPAYTTNLLVSGVLRPPLLAFALLSVPSIYARYLATSNPGLANQVSLLFYPLGSNVVADVAYVAVSALLMVGLTWFVVLCDNRSATREVRRHLIRLAAIAGVAIATLAAVLPIVEEAITRASGTFMPFNGAHLMLATAVVILVVRNLSRSGREPALPALQPALP